MYKCLNSLQVRVCRYAFKTNENVLAKWTDGHVYPAQVFETEGDTYSVYFPQDGKVLKGVQAEDMSRPSDKAVWAKYTRDDFATKFSHDEFVHDEKRKGVPRKHGKYRIVGKGTGNDINMYLCNSMVEGDDKEYKFDMGYVQRKMLLRICPLDDSGTKILDKNSLYE